MAGQADLLPYTLLGLMLIIAGILLVIAPLLLRFFEGLDRIHPLILVGFRIDGLYIGTSPIIIIGLLVVYLLLRFWRG